MTTVERTFLVPHAAADVLTYLKDLQSTVRWDPGTLSCPQLTPGPVKVGTQWRNYSRLFGVSTQLLYTLIAATETQVTFAGDNARAHTVDTITVVAVAGGCSITYRFEVIMKGWSKLSAPVMRLAFERVASLVVKQMTTALNTDLDAS